MNRIKLLTDYGCWPLWEYEDGDLYDNPHPSEYPLSENTVARLVKWQDTFDAILNQDDPASSDFPTAAARLRFELEGISLWQQVKQELEGKYEVVYFSDFLQYVVTDLEEVRHITSLASVIAA